MSDFLSQWRNLQLESIGQVQWTTNVFIFYKHNCAYGQSIFNHPIGLISQEIYVFGSRCSHHVGWFCNRRWGINALSLTAQRRWFQPAVIKCCHTSTFFPFCDVRERRFAFLLVLGNKDLQVFKGNGERWRVPVKPTVLRIDWMWVCSAELITGFNKCSFHQTLVLPKFKAPDTHIGTRAEALWWRFLLRSPFEAWMLNLEMLKARLAGTLDRQSVFP